MKHKLSLVFLMFAVAFIVACLFVPPNEACTSRTIPKPRPSSSVASSRPTAVPSTVPTTTASTTTTTTTTTTPRPNITFHTYKCPATYDAWYCLNEATCFSVKIGEDIMYSCECASGFMGPRCEFKELDGSFLPKRPRPILEKASIASGFTCALLLILFICLTMYLRYDSKTKTFECGDEVSEYSLPVAGPGRCRYCNDKRCCGDSLPPAADDDQSLGSGGGDLLANADNYRLRQHIEAFPLSFAIKRSIKM